MNFRTHDESDSAQQGGPSPRRPGVTTPQAGPAAANDNLAKVTACEAQKDMLARSLS